MTDHHLFWLDEDRKWDLACDRLQWMVRRHTGIHKQTGKPKFEGRWFIGGKKRSLVEGFERFGIKLTAEARAMLEALPESYPLFRLQPLEARHSVMERFRLPKCRTAMKRPRPRLRLRARPLEAR